MHAQDTQTVWVLGTQPLPHRPGGTKQDVATWSPDGRSHFTPKGTTGTTLCGLAVDDETPGKEWRYSVSCYVTCPGCGDHLVQDQLGFAAPLTAVERLNEQLTARLYAERS
jgi:hypothetical protein